MKQSLLAPKHYSLRSVLLSHGWSGLSPFQVSNDQQSIRFGFTGHGKPTVVQVQQVKKHIEIESSRRLNKKEIQIIERMFGLNRTLDSFFDLAQKHDRSWIQSHQMGRLMRSESVFEDLIKLILTTNCSWSLTKKMVSEMCEKLGEKEGEFHCFPKPETLARKNEAYFRNIIKTGYRAPYLIQTSKLVASKKMDVESWAFDDRPYTVLKKEILSLPGAGPYVAENLLRYLGKYDGLGVDSWVRGKLQKMWNMKKQPTDKKISQQYKKFGEYQGLVLWCDVTKDWYETESF